MISTCEGLCLLHSTSTTVNETQMATLEDSVQQWGSRCKIEAKQVFWHSTTSACSPSAKDDWKQKNKCVVFSSSWQKQQTQLRDHIGSILLCSSFAQPKNLVQDVDWDNKMAV